MRHPLPHDYTLNIRTWKERGEKCFEALLINPQGATILRSSGESPVDYPTRLAGSGVILRVMLENEDTRAKDILGDAYRDVWRKAVDMEGDFLSSVEVTPITPNV